MGKQARDSTKRKGRPATGNGTQVNIRLQADYLLRLDAWRAMQPGEPNRPEAIRLMMDKLLGDG